MRGLARFLYTQNPFYLISSAFVMVGLRQAFPPSSASATNAWLLAGALASYALLLVVTACVIVRLGKVWDDARTIALLVVLISLSISVSFDAQTYDHYWSTFGVLIAGCGFSVLALECLVRGMRIKLPWSFRIPIHVLTGLFFLYPSLITHGMWEGTSVTMPWRVLAFPCCAGLLTLTLIPAARIGRSLVTENGSPWPWPFYPWSAFFMIAVAVAGRSYLLTLAFQTNTGYQSTFAPYYLTPFLFAILVLLAERALAGKSSVATFWLSLAPLVLVALSLAPGWGTAYETFLDEVTTAFVSPVWLVAICGAFFCVYLWARGATNARSSIALMSVLCCFVDPRANGLSQLTLNSAWPLMIWWLVSSIHLWHKPTTLKLLESATVMLAFLTLSAPILADNYGLVPIHLLILVAVCAAFIFADGLALRLRRDLPLLGVGLCVLAVTFAISGDVRIDSSIIYVTCVVVGSTLIWGMHRMVLWKWSALMSSLLLLSLCAVRMAQIIETELTVGGAESLLAGGVCFLLGALLSAMKAGLAELTTGFLYREMRLLIVEWYRHSQKEAVLMLDARERV